MRIAERKAAILNLLLRGAFSLRLAYLAVGPPLAWRAFGSDEAVSHLVRRLPHSARQRRAFGGSVRNDIKNSETVIY
ncbi:MAG: hypothetical protein ISS57_03360 [Anaerolineales bacterium]|nr:hypothetical protein [Anaerolineales bacterium]